MSDFELIHLIPGHAAHSKNYYLHPIVLPASLSSFYIQKDSFLDK